MLRSFAAPLLLITVVFSFLSCRTPGSLNSQIKETEVRNYEDELGMRPGIGFDDILEDVRGECITHEGLEPGPSGQEASYQVRLVEKHSDLVGYLSISSASQVKAAVDNPTYPTSKKTKFALGTNFGISKYSVYLLVSARIRNGTEFLKNPKLKTDVQEILAGNNADSVNQFRRRCGDSFLTGSTSGGEFHALIEIETETDELNASLRREFRGSSDQQTSTNDSLIAGSLNAMMSNRDVRIWTYQRGGAGEDETGLVNNVDDVLNRMRQLATTASQGQNPKPLTATFSDYFTIGLNMSNEQIQALNKAKDTVANLARKLSTLLDLKSNISYILRNTRRFVITGDKLVQLERAQGQISTLVKALHDAGVACSRDINSCAIPDGTDAPNVDLPRRKPTLASLQNEKVKVQTKIRSIDRTALRDGWGNPPECYLQVRAGKYGGENEYISVYKSGISTGSSSTRCNNLQRTVRLPVHIIKDVYRSLGVGETSGWIEVLLFEADNFYDDDIGSTYISFKSLSEGAQLKGINNNYINMDVGFELEY